MKLARCPKCWTKFAGAPQVCAHCGLQLLPATPGAPVAQVAMALLPKPKPGVGTWLATALVMLVGLWLFFIWIYLPLWIGIGHILHGNAF